MRQDLKEERVSLAGGQATRKLLTLPSLPAHLEHKPKLEIL